LELCNLTSYFYDYIFPSIELITYTPKTKYKINNVRYKNIIIFGFMGSGKTETVRSIVNEAIKRYGKNNVNAVSVEDGSLDLLIDYGLKSTLINILFADNITLRKIDPYVMYRYFTIRHVYANRFNTNIGYILTISATHRFFGIPKEMRCTCDAIIVRNSTMNPYDRSILSKFITKEGLEFLERLEEAREHDRKLMKYSVFATKRKIGILETELAEESYLEEVLIPMTKVPSLILEGMK